MLKRFLLAGLLVTALAAPGVAAETLSSRNSSGSKTTMTAAAKKTTKSKAQTRKAKKTTHARRTRTPNTGNKTA